MKPYSTDLRLKIIEAKHKTNESIGQLAERFGVSYSFVSRLLKRYEATASVEPNPHGGGKPPLLNSRQIEILNQLVEEDNDATLQQLSVRLTEKTGIKVSIPTICRLLQKLELTRKKKTVHANEAESERVQKLRSQYWTTIREVCLKDLVFIDETGVNLAMTRRYARAKKGKRAYSKCPYNRGNNLTMMAQLLQQEFLLLLHLRAGQIKRRFLLMLPKYLYPNFGQGLV